MAVAAAAVVVTVATDAATMNVEADAATKELKILYYLLVIISNTNLSVSFIPLEPILVRLRIL